MPTQKRIHWNVLIVCLLVTYGAGLLGSLAMGDAAQSAWYASVKPSITPPAIVFPIVWNILFFLIALSLYFAWNASRGKDRRRVALIYGINLIANVLWTVFYFKLHRPDYAFFDIIIVWLSIANAMFLTWDIDRKASWLLLPYLLWVTFASVLNWLSI